MNAPMKFAELRVEDLSVLSRGAAIVSGVSFSLRTGRPLTLLGESGSGKSLVAQAVMGALPPGLTAEGSLRLDGADLLAEAPRQRRRRWGREIALLPQEPWLALDPTMKISAQVAETHRFVGGRSWRESEARTQADLAAVGLAQAAERHPFEMSGGMCQRAALCVVHAAGGALLIADEPTKGLDARLREEAVERLKAERDAGRLLLTITHDVSVAQALGGMIGVMLEGRMVEYGPAERVLRQPEHPYSRALIKADPAVWPDWSPPPAGDVVLEARGLTKSLGGRALFRDLDLDLRRGEILSLLGPSGCGKTTLGNVLLGLTPPDAGSLRLGEGFSRLRFQKLWQDPPAAFAPGQKLRAGLQDLARLHGRPWSRVEASMARLRLGDRLLDRRPGDISGGELQRFALLRALLLDPVFLFADEATSRLDPVSQKETADLLKEIVAETGLSLLMVTHDPVMARKLSTRILNLEAAPPSGSRSFSMESFA